jgi:hypothetical protein
LALLLGGACSRRHDQAAPSPQTSAEAAPGLQVAADSCADSERCREEGACVSTKNGCEPTKPEHCAHSAACRRDGMCRLLSDGGGRSCGSETHADCATSWLCRDHGRCRLAPQNLSGSGPCVEAKLRLHQRLPLTEARHGIRGELMVMVDARLPDSQLKDERGYFPEEEALRSAASVQVRRSDGVVVDELTLYPALDVVARNLGDGTDTFFATEHVACLAGHWCGWRMVPFQVQNGRLSRLRAVGDSGEERDMAVTASLGSRWALSPAKAGLLDLVYQVEGPSGLEQPVFVETRFSFQSGRWRFSEVRSSEYDKSVLHQPGKWSGTLEFHGG